MPGQDPASSFIHPSDAWRFFTQLCLMGSFESLQSSGNRLVIQTSGLVIQTMLLEESLEAGTFSEPS